MFKGYLFKIHEIESGLIFYFSCFGVFKFKGGSRMKGVKLMKEIPLNSRRTLSNINKKIMEAAQRPYMVNRRDPFG